MERLNQLLITTEMHTPVPEQGMQDPLSCWNNSIEDVTLIKRQHIQPVYKKLVKFLNERWYGKVLTEEPSLFIKGTIDETQHDSDSSVSDDDNDSDDFA